MLDAVCQINSDFLTDSDIGLKPVFSCTIITIIQYNRNNNNFSVTLWQFDVNIIYNTEMYVFNTFTKNYRMLFVANIKQTNMIIYDYICLLIMASI